MDNRKTDPFSGEDERSPLFKSWRRLYAVVILNLILLIVLFTVIMKIFQ